MQYFRTEAFRRIFRNLDAHRQKRVEGTLIKLDNFFTKGTPPAGLGLKKLRHGVWEIRAGIEDRVLFQREGDLVQLLIVGNHEEIRRFLGHA